MSVRHLSLPVEITTGSRGNKKAEAEQKGGATHHTILLGVAVTPHGVFSDKVVSYINLLFYHEATSHFFIMDTLCYYMEWQRGLHRIQPLLSVNVKLIQSYLASTAP